MSKKPKKPTQKEQDLDGIDPRVYRRRWWILATLCLTLLGVMLANSSLNMALPLMALDLELDQLQITWVVNVYTLVFASFLFLAGAIGDRYGRRLTMQIGLAIFTAGSLYAGFLAQTGVELIISRVVMGIGGAFVMPVTLSIVNNTFPKHERARAVAIWGAVAGIGMMIGSVISGVLLEHFTWHSLFYFSAAVAVVGIILNQILVNESRDEGESPVDWLGGVLAAIGIFGVVYAVTEMPTQGIAYGWVLTASISGVVGLVLFVLWQLRAKSPMLDMKLFKNRAFSISSLTLTLTFLAMSGVFFSMSQLMQLVMGYTALESSLLMIPLMIPMVLLSPFIPNVVKWIGARLTVSIGLFITSVAFLMMSFWTKDMGYWDLISAIGVMMLGISAAMTPGTNILMASVPRNRSGMGSAMNDTTRELGGALGVAVLGAILSAVYSDKITAVAAHFTGPMKEAVEKSLATALGALSQVGEAAEPAISAARDAWMAGMSQAAIVAAAIIFTCSLIAFFGLPKHSDKSDDII